MVLLKIPEGDFQVILQALLDARLSNAAFRRDMDTLLRPGLPKFDVDVGASVVRNTFFTHLEP